MKDILFALALGLLFGVVLVVAAQQDYNRTAKKRHLIHCRNQVSVEEEISEYHVVHSYWISEDGCLNGEFHGEVVDKLCTCHIESDKKFKEWEDQLFEELVDE